MFLPIFFICFMNGQCDIAVAPMQSTLKECETFVINAQRNFEQDDNVRQYLSRCAKLDMT